MLVNGNWLHLFGQDELIFTQLYSDTGKFDTVKRHMVKYSPLKDLRSGRDDNKWNETWQD